MSKITTFFVTFDVFKFDKMKRRDPPQEIVVKMTGERLVVHHVVEMNDHRYPDLMPGTVICKNPKWLPVPEPEFLVFGSFQVEKA